MKKAPAPIGGLNFLIADNRLPETDAKLLDNWIPDAGFCRLRESGVQVGDTAIGLPECQPYACNALSTVFSNGANAFQPAGTPIASFFPLPGTDIRTSFGFSRWDPVTDTDFADGCNNESLVLECTTALAGGVGVVSLISNSFTYNDPSELRFAAFLKGTDLIDSFTGGSMLFNDLQGTWRIRGPDCSTIEIAANPDWTIFPTLGAGGVFRMRGRVTHIANEGPPPGYYAFPSGGDIDVDLGPSIDVSDAAGSGLLSNWVFLTFRSTLTQEAILYSVGSDPATITQRLNCEATYFVEAHLVYVNGSGEVVTKSSTFTGKSLLATIGYVPNEDSCVPQELAFEWDNDVTSSQGIRQYFAGGRYRIAHFEPSYYSNAEAVFRQRLRNNVGYQLPAYCP